MADRLDLLVLVHHRHAGINMLPGTGPNHFTVGKWAILGLNPLLEKQPQNFPRPPVAEWLQIFIMLHWYMIHS